MTIYSRLFVHNSACVRKVLNPNHQSLFLFIRTRTILKYKSFPRFREKRYLLPANVKPKRVEIVNIHIKHNAIKHFAKKLALYFGMTKRPKTPKFLTWLARNRFFVNYIHGPHSTSSQNSSARECRHPSYKTFFLGITPYAASPNPCFFRIPQSIL